jgi:hypothetical protein
VIGFVRFFIAERLRQRAARFRAIQVDYPADCLGHDRNKAVADCYDARDLIETLDDEALSRSAPVTEADLFAADTAWAVGL